MAQIERMSPRLHSRETMICRLLILCAIFLLGGGCAGASLDTVGTLLNAAGSAASAGTEVYSLGKLDFSVMATFDQCRCAVADATRDLELHMESCDLTNKQQNEIVFKLVDDRKTRIDIRIDRRSGKLCQCRVDVGWFGSEPTAKLIMQRIAAHLPRTEGRPAVEASPPKTINPP
jgi:uncharacterized protein DUF3568